MLGIKGNAPMWQKGGRKARVNLWGGWEQTTSIHLHKATLGWKPYTGSLNHRILDPSQGTRSTDPIWYMTLPVPGSSQRKKKKKKSQHAALWIKKANLWPSTAYCLCLLSASGSTRGCCEAKHRTQKPCTQWCKPALTQAKPRLEVRAEPQS